MISINPDQIKAAIKKHKTIIESDYKKIKSSLKSIVDNYRTIITNEERIYLNKLQANVKLINIITADLTTLESIKADVGEFPLKLTTLKLTYKDKNGQNCEGNTDLRELLETCFNYKKKRGEFYPSFFQSIGIKACIYCNSQLAVVIKRTTYGVSNKKNGTELVAKFQVDHYLPQKKYPYLATSLYNLYPVCGPCNNAKKENPVDFELYSNNYKSSIYSFSLDSKSVTEYLTSYNKEKLKIRFHDPNKNKRLVRFKGSFEDTFSISAIYETQKDIAEEIILKSQIYNSSYRNMLKKAFDEIISDQSFAGRLLLGNYTEPEEIHKRPLAKFMQDIAIQMKLIKR